LSRTFRVMLCAGLTLERNPLFDGMLGVRGFASVGRLFEQQAMAQYSSQPWIYVDIGYCACLAVASQQLYDAVAVLAANSVSLSIRATATASPSRTARSLRLLSHDAVHFAFVDLFRVRLPLLPRSPDRLRSSFTCGHAYADRQLFVRTCAGAKSLVQSEVISNHRYITSMLRGVAINVAPLTGRVTMPSSIR